MAHSEDSEAEPTQPDSADQTSHIPNERLIKGVLASTIAASSFTIQIFLPALPSVQNAFDVSAAQVQLTVSLPLVVTAVATLLYGPLSDRFGRRPALIGGMLLFFVGTVMCLLATSIVTLILGRFIQAVGGAAGVVIARAAVLAGLVAVMVIAPMIAPTLGGFLVDGFGWRGNVGATALFAGALLALVVFGMPETHKPVTGDSIGVASMAYGFRTLLSSPAFCAYTFQSAFMIGIFYVFLAAAPYAVMTVMGLSGTEYGLYFLFSTGGYLTGTILANRISERVGIDPMVRIGTSTAIVTLMMVLGLVALGVWHPLAIFLPITVLGVANGMSLPNANAGAISVYPELAGTASGLTSFIQYGVAALFAQVSGSWQDGTPYPLAICMLIAALGAWASFSYFKRKELRNA